MYKCKIMPWIAILTLILLVSAVWAAEPAKPSKLSVIISVERAPYVEVKAKEFEKKYGIPVEVIVQSYFSTHSRIVTTFASATPADVAYVDIIWVSEFAESKILLPIDKYITSGLKQEVSPWLGQATWKGKLWAVPVGCNEKKLYYNKTYLKSIGSDQPPKTWNELVDLSKKLMEAKICKYGIAWGWKQSEILVCDYTALLNAFKGTWRDAKGRWVFNEGGGLKALEFMTDMLYKDKIVDPGSLAQDDRTIMNTFATGDIAFAATWPFGWLLATNPASSKVVNDVAVTRMPGITGSTESATVTGIGNMGIMATTKNKEWAWKLLEVLSDRDAQLLNLKLSNYPPTWKSLYGNAEVLKEYPRLQYISPEPQYAHNRPSIPWYSEWSTIMQTYLMMALTKQCTPKEALDGAAAESNVKSKLYGY